MQNFRIFPEGYEEPKPVTRWFYDIGAKWIAVKDLTESFTVQVRTA